jgi:hypothetical protein
MTDPALKNEGVSAEDRAYRGSRFQDIVAALFANPYKKVWGRDGEPAWPDDEVRFTDVMSRQFDAAAERTLDTAADLRWGPDGKGFRRTLHPNGICLTGEWRITQDLGYSGYFGAGSRGLVVARYSTSSLETLRGQTRSFGLVGKIFPTTDPNHSEPLWPGQLLHAGGHRRRRHDVHERRGSAQRARHHDRAAAEIPADLPPDRRALR